MLEKLRQSRGWQLLFISVLILLLPLLVDINERVNVIQRMRQEEARLEDELKEVQAEHEALQTELEFVSGDDYLEQWARVEARMTRPGETAIIPLRSEPAEENVTREIDSPPQDRSPASIPEQWHRLFFDTPTP